MNMICLEHSGIRTQRFDNLPRSTQPQQEPLPIELIMSIQDKQARDIVAYFHGLGSQDDMNIAVLMLIEESEVEQAFGDVENQHNLDSLMRFVKAVAQAYRYDQLFAVVLSRVFEKHHKGLRELEENDNA